MQDPEFRARLLSDTRNAVGDALGAPMPDGFSVEVMEQQPNKVTLVLPVNELSQQQVAEVGGGSNISGVFDW